jgi:outer membrane protein assembly factor BamB
MPAATVGEIIFAGGLCSARRGRLEMIGWRKPKTGRVLCAAVALAVVLVPVSGASARGAAAALSLSKTKAPPTALVVVGGSGFASGEPVDLSLGSASLGSVQADGGGGFSLAVRIPAATLPGSYTLTAVGRSSGLEAGRHLTVRANWAQLLSSGARGGFNPYENVLGPGNVGGMVELWHKSSAVGIDSSPVVSNGLVYIAEADFWTTDQLLAYNALTGRLRWSANTWGDVHGAPAVANGVVYVATERGNQYLEAFDATTGTQLWSAPVGSYCSPAVADGTVYLTGLDGRLYAFDAASGALRWNTPNISLGPFSSPSAAKGMAYVGSGDGNLYAFDAATGTQQWTAQTGGPVDSSPAVVNGVVYIGSEDGSVYAFSARTGALRWSTPTGGAILGSAAVANGTVYIGSFDGNLYALDSKTGAVRWTWQSTYGGWIESAIAVANGVVYPVVDDMFLYAVDTANGTELWSWHLGSQTRSSPAVANGIVYIGSWEGTLHAFGLPPG